ncbi:MAG TPA: hypothetical protein VG738_15345 [Chitinophagaceae bacterium]|nr:hypothetical protein [Chitinophagaceae bacterium]
MKKLFVLLLSFISCYSVWAQLAVVNDSAGFVAVRENVDAKSKITDTLHNGRVVLSFDVHGKWLFADYSRHGKTLSGHIPALRVTFFNNMTKFSKSSVNDSTIILSFDSMKIIIATGKFEKNKSTIQYGKRDVFVKSINGKFPYGTDGNLPRRQYKLINVHINGNSIAIDKNCWADLFEPSLALTNAFIDTSRKTIYLAAQNSDGAGTYTVVWEFKNGQYSNREVFLAE